MENSYQLSHIDFLVEINLGLFVLTELTIIAHFKGNVRFAKNVSYLKDHIGSGTRGQEKHSQIVMVFTANPEVWIKTESSDITLIFII